MLLTRTTTKMTSGYSDSLSQSHTHTHLHNESLCGFSGGWRGHCLCGDQGAALPENSEVAPHYRYNSPHDPSRLSQPQTSSEVFPQMLSSLWRHWEIHPKERWECKHLCMRCDLRLSQMNVNINFNLPVIIRSSVPQELKNHLPISLSKQRSMWGSIQTKVTSLCVILHSVREEDAETIQPTGHHSLIQQSFISPRD